MPTPNSNSKLMTCLNEREDESHKKIKGSIIRYHPIWLG